MGYVTKEEKRRDMAVYTGGLAFAIQEEDVFNIMLCIAYIMGMLFGDTDKDGNTTWTTPIIQANSNYSLGYFYKLKNTNLVNATRNKSFRHFSNIFSKYYKENYDLLAAKNVDIAVLEAFNWIYDNLSKVQEFFDHRYNFAIFYMYAHRNNITIDDVLGNNKDMSLNQLADKLSKEMNF